VLGLEVLPVAELILVLDSDARHDDPNSREGRQQSLDLALIASFFLSVVVAVRHSRLSILDDEEC
jgi:hypothetical protein